MTKSIQFLKTKFTKSAFKKIGVVGILFFLLKGVAWIVVTYLILK